MVDGGWWMVDGKNHTNIFFTQKQLKDIVFI
jgi:hypothetical protein